MDDFDYLDGYDDVAGRLAFLGPAAEFCCKGVFDWRIILIMKAASTFAPLTGRLAACADEIHAAAASKDDWAKIVALLICALLHMLICVCEALDARAAAMARAVVAPAMRDGVAGDALAARSGQAARSVVERAPPMARMPALRAISLDREAVLSGPAKLVSDNPWRPLGAQAWRERGGGWRPGRSYRETPLCHRVSARIFCYDIVTKYWLVGRFPGREGHFVGAPGRRAKRGSAIRLG